jgi:hypothetical protein
MLLAILVPQATCHELRIGPYTYEEAKRALSRVPLLEHFVEEEATRRPSDPFQLRIDAVREQWGATGDPSLLAALFGLGAGSTPSGDDILMGILAGLTAFAGTSTTAASQRVALSTFLELSIGGRRLRLPRRRWSPLRPKAPLPIHSAFSSGRWAMLDLLRARSVANWRP